MFSYPRAAQVNPLLLFGLSYMDEWIMERESRRPIKRHSVRVVMAKHNFIEGISIVKCTIVSV